MSWLRGSPLASSFTKQRSRDSPPKDADPVACYDSFREHWQQSHNIIAHSTPPKNKPPSQDDVLGVVNHVDQMINLLQLEMRDFSNVQQRLQIQRMQQKNMVATAQLTAHHTPCLEHLLSENLLDKLFDWSEHTGRYGAAVRVEQLKLYELLISHDSSLLTHEPVTRPLLHLLDGCAGDTILPEVQKKLITLLNYICVALVQNTELLGLFFRPTATGKNRFIVFSLLVSYIHKEGSLGQQARDAMLHCMSLSKTNEEIGNYIAEESHICSVLAMGLSGLYSLLPRTLDIENEDWHRLTVDDVNDIPALTQLMNSLDFCNAVAQVVHPSVQKQLMEFLYKGFLIPVIGPALLQESVGLTLDELDSMIYRTSVEELIAATAYFDLFLRSVTEPGLLGLILKFLLEEYYDENRIFDHLIQRISSQGSRLSLVTLALFETLVDLNCEDVMLELCLGALAPCSHVMLSQRRRLLRDLDPFGRCAERFLALTPSCCSSSTVPTAILAATAGVSPIASPDLRRQNIATVSIAQQQQQQQQQQQSATNANALKNTSLAFRSLYSNYYAYLRDARQKIAACQIACSTWSRKYEDEEEDTLGVEVIDPDDTDNENGNFDECYEDDSLAFDLSPDKEVERKNSTDEKVNRIIASFSPKPIKTQKLQVTGRVRADSVEDITKRLTREEREKLEADIAELLSESCSSTPSAKSPSDDSTAALNSLSLSGGESSGYESFACSNNNANNGKSLSPLSNELSIGSTSSQKPVLIHQRRRRLQRRDAKDARLESIDAKPPSVGIFFDVVLKKLENMMENNVYVNLHLTGLISRLAIYPQPLLQSFLLNHTLVFQPSIKSLFQILASLKHRIDAFIAKQSEGNISSLVEQARVFLITRENRLVNIRKNVLEAAAQCPSPRKNQPSNESAYSNVNWAGKASEPRKKSLTSSLTQMFRKTSNTESNSSTDSYNNNHNASSLTLENENRNGNVKYIKHVNSWETPNKISRLQNVILCAVILDEWLKELAAITQEHTIISWFCAASISDGPQNEDLD